MVEPGHCELSIVRQCVLLNISRSSFYYEALGENPFNLLLMRQIDEQFLETLYYGFRQMARYLRRCGFCVSRKRIRRLMRNMGLVPLPEAQHEQASSGAQDLPLSVEGAYYQSP